MMLASTQLLLCLATLLFYISQITAFPHAEPVPNERRQLSLSSAIAPTRTSEPATTTPAAYSELASLLTASTPSTLRSVTASRFISASRITSRTSGRATATSTPRPISSGDGDDGDSHSHRYWIAGIILPIGILMIVTGCCTRCSKQARRNRAVRDGNAGFGDGLGYHGLRHGCGVAGRGVGGQRSSLGVPFGGCATRPWSLRSKTVQTPGDRATGLGGTSTASSAATMQTGEIYEAPPPPYEVAVADPAPTTQADGLPSYPPPVARPGS